MKKAERFLFLDGPSIYSSKTRRSGNDSRTVLFHSKHGQWASDFLGKPCVRLIEDGNGVDVKFVDGPSFRLTYSQFVELRMALSAHAWDEYKKVKL